MGFLLQHISRPTVRQGDRSLSRSAIAVSEEGPSQDEPDGDRVQVICEIRSYNHKQKQWLNSKYGEVKYL